jgi:hypothetical protein
MRMTAKFCVRHEPSQLLKEENVTSKLSLREIRRSFVRLVIISERSDLQTPDSIHNHPEWSPYTD